MADPRDRHNRLISPGDLVDAVYGGDHHRLVVREVTTEHDHHYLTGDITIRVPAAAVSRVDRPPSPTPSTPSGQHSRKGR